MKPRDIVILVILSAIWGGSFLFMKIAVAAFGPIPLVFLRTSVSCLILWPFLMAGRHVRIIKEHAGWLLLVGCLNSAMPFSLLAFSSWHLEAGFVSLLNAATPLSTAVVAALWFQKPLRPQMIAGLLLGIAGVALLSWDRISFKPGGTGWAVMAALLATLCYAIAANLSKAKLTGLPAIVTCWGSMAGASLVLLGPTMVFLPNTMPDTGSWMAGLALAILCTAVAYVLYFHLMRNAGATAVTSVTFIVPVFALLFAWLWLGEMVSVPMIQGMILALVGTALVTGVFRRRARGAEAIV